MSKLRKWMMKEERDTNSTGSADLSSSAIKLFGKTIAVADSKAASEEEVEQLEGENLKEGEVVNGEVTTVVEEKKEQCSLKKPDKLIPCPRCESVDTKFCYYNNYNINQPRHFCKSCQRYWTAGGTLRNVLVGAGRRKNKYGVQGAQGKEEEQHSTVRVDHHEPAQQPMSTVYGTVPPMSLPRHSETSTVTSMGCPSAFKPLGPEVSSDSVTKLRQRTSDVNVTNKSSDCATSSSGETTTPTQTPTPATYVLTPRAAPEQAAVWTKPAATPLGFFNGAWPYGYNIGWTTGGTQGGPPSAATAALCVPHSGNWGGMCVPTFGWNMLQGGWTLPWRPVPAVGVQMQGGPGIMTSNRKRDAGSDGDARAGKIARVGASAGDEPVAAV